MRLISVTTGNGSIVNRFESIEGQTRVTVINRHTGICLAEYLTHWTPAEMAESFAARRDSSRL